MNNMRPKILHIDDEDFFLDYFTMNYKAFFNITSVNNGAEAISKFGDEEYDAVITDFEIPDYNGLELLKIFRESTPDIPVIFYTSQGNENIAREVFMAGASDYFTKDINKFAHREKFVHSVESAIERKKAEQALKYRHNFEQIIISLSRKFMNQPSELIDDTITEALETISRLGKIDHSFIVLPKENTEDFACTHEWRDEGVQSTFRNQENLNAAEFPWFSEEIAKNDILYISGADSLPVEAANEKSVLLIEGIQSILLIALKYEERNIGILGLASHYPDKIWSNEFKSLIRIIADIITGAIIRKKHEDELFKHRESLEDIVKERTMMLIDINRKMKQEIGGRIEVEETLRRSEEKYRRIFENIQDVYFEAGVNGIVHELSPSVQLISKYKREELISTSIYKRYMNPADREETIKKLMKSGYLNDHEVIFKDRDGSPIYCSINTRLEYDKEGKPEKLVGTIRNIARRKKTEEELKRYKDRLEELVEDRTRQLLLTNESLKKEIRENEKAREALRESEKKYKQLFEKLQDIFYHTDMEGTITLVSPSVEKIMGYKPEEVIGKNVIEKTYIDPLQWQEFLKMLKRKAELNNYIIRLKKKDDTMIWVSTNARFLKNENDEIIGVEGIARDITDQKIIMDELMKKNDELALIHASSQLFASSLDLNLLIHTVTENILTLLNAEAGSVWLLDKESGNFQCFQATDLHKEIITGWKLESGQGIVGWVIDNNKSIIIDDAQTDIRFCPEIDKKTGMKTRSIICVPLVLKKEVIGALELVDSRQNKFSSNDQSILELIASSASISFENARLYGEIQNELEKRRNAENLLIIKNNELEDFAYRISHDLKNPLILINGFISSISEYPDLFNEFFPRIITLTDKLAKIIDNLLKLSRAGKVIDKKELINTEQLIHETYMFLSDREIKSKIVIESPIPPINGDPDSVREIFSCLIANSFRFRDPAKDQVLIEVSGEQKENASVIRFRDNCIGIKEEHLEKIFNPGFAFSINRGTGFGLSIVQKIVKAHGGEVVAKSDGMNKGTEFIFTFS